MSFRSHLHSACKSFAAKSRLAQHAYGLYLYRRAMIALREGKTYEALDLLCTVCRRIPQDSVTSRHLKALCEIVRESCYKNGALALHRDNELLRSFSASPLATNIRQQRRAEPLADRVRLRRHRNDGDAGRQGNMMILKVPKPETGEKGVMILTYNSTFAELPAVFDLVKILKRYRVVVEPSYSRNFEPAIFLYLGSDADVLLTSSQADDQDFVRKTGLNFTMVPLGASDWVDPNVFSPAPDGERQYDVVMVAAWLRIKRHGTLFQAIKALHPRKLRVALIGYPMDLTAAEVRKEMRRFGVEKQCDLFENLAPPEVARIVGRSKVAVHLTKQEGTNKATYEALCCNTPLIVYRHNLGFPMSSINERTGLLAADNELADAIAWAVDHYLEFQPRAWALEHTGYLRATRTLNDCLRDAALRRREPWTQDIVARVNLVNPRYKFESDRLAMEPAYSQLEELLNPC